MIEPATDAGQVGGAGATASPPAGGTLDAIEGALRDRGPEAALERLAAALDDSGDYRALLDALLLRARYDLGLPLIASGSLAGIPEPVRSQYEERYVDAIRQVGSRYLAAGDIPTAWAYFRVIGENEPIAQAIRNYVHDRDGAAGDGDRLGSIIEVAFNHGVDPLRGFELILSHYGTCSAISAFDGLPGQDEPTRIACAERLIRHLHRELVANIRSDILGRGQLAPPPGATIAEIVATREWLFADDSYHIDISHLASVVRMAVLATDPEVIALAADLTEYGRRLSPRLQFEGSPPFERVFEDHGVYLRALLGQDVDAAIAHFRAKLGPPAADPESAGSPVPAQILISLLVRLGRLDEAIEIAAAYLSGQQDSSLFCPNLAQLCQQAGKPGRLAELARDRADAVNYTAALLLLGHSPAAPGQSPDV